MIANNIYTRTNTQRDRDQLALAYESIYMPLHDDKLCMIVNGLLHDDLSAWL